MKYLVNIKISVANLEAFISTAFEKASTYLITFLELKTGLCKGSLGKKHMDSQRHESIKKYLVFKTHINL